MKIGDKLELVLVAEDKPNTCEGCLGCAFEKAESCSDAPLCSGADLSVRFKIVGDENA